MKNAVTKCSLGLAIVVSAFGAHPGLGQTHSTCPVPGISIGPNVPVAEVNKKIMQRQKQAILSVTTSKRSQRVHVAMA